jgi:hypothetical protein
MSQAMSQTAATTAIPAGLLDKRMTAEYCRVCEKTIDNLVRRGVLVPVRMTRRVMFRREDVDSVIAAARSSKGVYRPSAASASSGSKVGG